MACTHAPDHSAQPTAGKKTAAQLKPGRRAKTNRTATQIRLKTMEAFCPPKPRLLLIATSTLAVRFTFGT